VRGLQGREPEFVVSLAALLFLAFVLAMVLNGCTPGSRWNAIELLANKIACAVENQDLPNEAILAKCAVQPGDADRVLNIVSQSREKVSKAGALRCSGGAQ
jgi:hypothetical protein